MLAFGTQVPRLNIILDCIELLFIVELEKEILLNLKISTSESHNFHKDTFCVILAPFPYCKQAPYGTLTRATLGYSAEHPLLGEGGRFCPCLTRKRVAVAGRTMWQSKALDK